MLVDPPPNRTRKRRIGRFSDNKFDLLAESGKDPLQGIHRRTHRTPLVTRDHCLRRPGLPCGLDLSQTSFQSRYANQGPDIVIRERRIYPFGRIWSSRPHVASYQAPVTVRCQTQLAVSTVAKVCRLA